MAAKEGGASAEPIRPVSTPSVPIRDATPGSPPPSKPNSRKVIILDDHFRYISDRNRAAALFKASVRIIEIEIQSYCNRTCEFCGNSFIDRRGNKTLMDPALYSKIIDDLASINYSGWIGYSRYNEPTSDRPLFIERLREARAKLPFVRLETFTNGDYLTGEYIEALRDAGLNNLQIYVYLEKGEEATPANFLNTMIPRLIKLGIPWKFVAANHVELDIPGIRVNYNFADFLKHGTNRGASVSTGNIIERRSPCTIPFTAAYVDFNGCMVPCCDIRSDFEQHKECIVYKLTPQNSIFDGYANSKLVLWRQDLSSFGPKKLPCNTCSRQTYPETPEMQKLFTILSGSVNKTSLSS